MSCTTLLHCGDEDLQLYNWTHTEMIHSDTVIKSHCESFSLWPVYVVFLHRIDPFMITALLHSSGTVVRGKKLRFQWKIVTSKTHLIVLQQHFMEQCIITTYKCLGWMQDRRCHERVDICLVTSWMRVYIVHKVIFMVPSDN